MFWVILTVVAYILFAFSAARGTDLTVIVKIKSVVQDIVGGKTTVLIDAAFLPTFVIIRKNLYQVAWAEVC